ncbi:hypothetical protein F0L68_06580 [Solihabitans fulvus]|uniref:Mce-associated membrane protein n=1 Tax=Solihabitans fulvus TaxID=1892852 RepID=A0A5B2XPF4_9PSEU|nr:hypothetical protein [Solihabitans fulvus]KAA2264749.1 hypothetical protein F0L68_06580 [Solihabitans fulvus]
MNERVRSDGRPSFAHPAVLAAAAVAVVAAVFAAWFGWSWYSAAHDDSLRYASTRDDVQRAGEVGIDNFTTLDYKKVDEGLDRWLASSTAQLNDEVKQGRDASKKQIEAAKTVTKGKVLESSVTDLDDRAGKATLIAAVEIVVTPDGGQPTTKRDRYQANLTRTDAGWKLSALGQVAVGTA